ncbi:hypothetical protein GG344DRAFT_79450 [Lentinula edodes]|nr:hypothetical protein GG344DRAFT_79450 [Lentinula edodes]
MQPDPSHDPDHHRGNIKATRSSFRASNAGPYGRVYTRRLDPKLKNWENVLENALFNPNEPIHLKQQSRKMFYGVSLEAYVERLHAQMLRSERTKTSRSFCGEGSYTADLFEYETYTNQDRSQYPQLGQNSKGCNPHELQKGTSLLIGPTSMLSADMNCQLELPEDIPLEIFRINSPDQESSPTSGVIFNNHNCLWFQYDGHDNPHPWEYNFNDNGILDDMMLPDLDGPHQQEYNVNSNGTLANDGSLDLMLPGLDSPYQREYIFNDNSLCEQIDPQIPQWQAYRPDGLRQSQEHPNLPLHAPVPIRPISIVLLTDFEDTQNPRPLSGPSPTSNSDSGAMIDAVLTITPAPSHNADVPSQAEELQPELSILRLPQPPLSSLAITPLEQNRQYLECLEEYTLYLNNKIMLIGAQPAPIGRLHSKEQCMSGRSLRTILVHLGNLLVELDLQILKAEEQFHALRDAYLHQASENDSEDPAEYVMGSIPNLT